MAKGQKKYGQNQQTAHVNQRYQAWQCDQIEDYAKVTTDGSTVVAWSWAIYNQHNIDCPENTEKSTRQINQKKLIHLQADYVLILVSLKSLPIPPIIPECTAPNGVHNNEEDEEYYVNNSYLLPVSLDVLE